MNTKNNQRTRLSKMMLKNALLDLLREKGSITKISVRELCEKAELNRSTFYVHYGEPKQLLTEVEDELLEATGEHLRRIGAENDSGAYKFLLSFLQYVKANDKPFRILLIDSADPSFRSRFMQQAGLHFIQNLDLTFLGSSEQFIDAYLLNGSTGVILQWIRSGYEAKEEAICSLLFSLNRNALENLPELLK